MFNEQLAKLEKQKADLAAAEAKLAADRVIALAKLPGDYGFDSVDSFIKAVKAAAGSKAAKRGRKVKGAAKAPKAAKASKGKGKRTKITDDIKAQVKAMSEAGKTGLEIAKALSISQPSVQNIRKALGLVKARAAGSAPAAA